LALLKSSSRAFPLVGLISPKGASALAPELLDSSGFSLARYQRDRIFDFMDSGIEDWVFFEDNGD
jgi:hypothetical protein